MPTLLNAQPSEDTLKFMEMARAAVADAQAASLAAGAPIAYRDSAGRYVREYPDGRIFEIRFHPEKTGEGHVELVRELTESSR